MDYPKLTSQQEINEYGLIYDLGSLYDYFSEVEDTRSKHGKQFPLTTLLTWMLLAKPSGMAEWIAHRKEIWVGYQLTDKEKTPSPMTDRRVLQDLLSGHSL